jgi:uncharacterized C2H2 Zn-finger protein
MKKHKCPYCPKSFQSPKDLDKHLQKIHKLSPITIKETTSAEKAEFIDQCMELMEKSKK